MSDISLSTLFTLSAQHLLASSIYCKFTKSHNVGNRFAFRKVRGRNSTFWLITVGQTAADV